MTTPDLVTTMPEPTSPQLSDDRHADALRAEVITSRWREGHHVPDEDAQFVFAHDARATFDRLAEKIESARGWKTALYEVATALLAVDIADRLRSYQRRMEANERIAALEAATKPRRRVPAPSRAM